MAINRSALPSVLAVTVDEGEGGGGGGALTGANAAPVVMVGVGVVTTEVGIVLVGAGVDVLVTAWDDVLTVVVVGAVLAVVPVTLGGSPGWASCGGGDAYPSSTVWVPDKRTAAVAVPVTAAPTSAAASIACNVE